MIRYRKTGALRVGRGDAPEPPFGAAVTLEPYSFPRTTPLAFDYIRLLGTAVNRAEVQVSNPPGQELVFPTAPVLIDSTGPAELVYRRGEALHARLLQDGSAEVVQLISSDGPVPELKGSIRSRLGLCAWPPQALSIATLAREAADRGLVWGLAIPVAFPATTELELLERMADAAAEHHAAFLIAVRIDLDPSARRALSAMIPADDETYSTLFDEGAEAVSIATERHIAALAAERQLDDFLWKVPPERSNWMAAARIATAGYRLLQMAEEAELGWEFVRSARLIATLDKPLARIAAAANLAIIEPLPPQITEALEEWLGGGSPALFNEIDNRWRLRRDYRR